MRPESHLAPSLQTLFLFMRLFFKKANRIIDNSGAIPRFIARENPNLIFLLQYIPPSHVGTGLGNDTFNYSCGLELFWWLLASNGKLCQDYVASCDTKLYYFLWSQHFPLVTSLASK